MKHGYLAHSANRSGQEHELKEHLQHTAQRASMYGCEPACKNVVQRAVLLHDCGKYLPAFQNYLRQGGVRGSVPHARWGAMLARCLNAQEVSFAIDGAPCRIAQLDHMGTGTYLYQCADNTATVGAICILQTRYWCD